MISKKDLTIPNIITALRIVGSVGLLFTEIMSVGFYVLYSVCGITDVLDGFIARLTKSESDLGAKLDSIADLLFYGVMFFKIMPYLISVLPLWLWMFVGVILLVRASSYLVAAIKYHRFASVHTYLNKLTGAVVFAIPYFMGLKVFVPVCLTVAVVAMSASSEELCIHLTSKEYNSSRKTVLPFFNK